MLVLRLVQKLEVSVSHCLSLYLLEGCRKLKLLENTDGNLCRATEERTYRLTVKLCPPPEDPDFTLCSAFTKSIWQKDYWQKQGAVDVCSCVAFKRSTCCLQVWMKFYERGLNRPELERQFLAELDNPLLGKVSKSCIDMVLVAIDCLDLRDEYGEDDNIICRHSNWL